MVFALFLFVAFVKETSGETVDGLPDETSLLQLHRMRDLAAVNETATVFVDADAAEVETTEQLSGEGGCSRRRGRRRRRTVEFSCWEPCGCKAGLCNACGENRACCRWGRDGHVNACRRLTEPPLNSMHVCRDTTETKQYPEDQNGEWDCFRDCGSRGGKCRKCGPYGACCRADHSANQPECQNVGAPHGKHRCRRAWFGPKKVEKYWKVGEFNVQGRWESYRHLTGEQSLTIETGYTESTGGSYGYTLSSEFTQEVKAGGFFGETTYSLTLGAEYTQERNWGKEKSYTESTTYTLEVGDRDVDAPHVWRWDMISSVGAQRMTRMFAQTQSKSHPPQCLPNHFYAYSRTQVCNYGFRIDGTGGDYGWNAGLCRGRPEVKQSQAGAKDSYRGWYDVSGCGEAWDYCRWVGRSKGDPSKFGTPDEYLDGLSSIPDWKCITSKGDDVAAVDLPGWWENRAGPRPYLPGMFERMDIGAKGCRRATLNVPQDKCVVAAHQLNGKNGIPKQDGGTARPGGLHRLGRWPSIPSGCTIRNGVIYYNTMPDDATRAHEAWTPLCLRREHEVKYPHVQSSGEVGLKYRSWNFRLFETVEGSDPGQPSPAPVPPPPPEQPWGPFQAVDIRVGRTAHIHRRRRNVVRKYQGRKDLLCPTDSADKHSRVNSDKSGDRFRVTVDTRKKEIETKRIDKDAGWGMDLWIRCWYPR